MGRFFDERLVIDFLGFFNGVTPAEMERGRPFDLPQFSVK
jgi:hypothetical protein